MDDAEIVEGVVEDVVKVDVVVVSTPVVGLEDVELEAVSLLLLHAPTSTSASAPNKARHRDWATPARTPTEHPKLVA